MYRCDGCHEVKGPRVAMERRVTHVVATEYVRPSGEHIAYGSEITKEGVFCVACAGTVKPKTFLPGSRGVRTVVDTTEIKRPRRSERPVEEEMV